jgi:TPR repeat protein
LRDLEDAENASLARNAEAGRAWAQLQMGLMTMEGDGNIEKDRFKAAGWFSLAADQGSAMAMSMLSVLWEEGFPELGVPSSKQKADQYMIQAAKHGSSIHQSEMAGLAREGSESSLIWYTLASAQGDAKAQNALGGFHMNGTHGMPRSVFAAIYWLRKAALQGEPTAQGCLAFALLMAKSLIYDGQEDIVGYSAVPEARFWLGLSEDTLKKMQVPPLPRPEMLQTIKCGRCGETAMDKRTHRLCSKCKCIGYCSKSCQAAHWKMGHKRDCASVCACIEEMKNRPSTYYNNLE